MALIPGYLDEKSPRLSAAKFTEPKLKCEGLNFSAPPKLVIKIRARNADKDETVPVDDCDAENDVSSKKSENSIERIAKSFPENPK